MRPAPDESRLTVTLELSADRFGQLMQGRLFVVRPGALTSGSDYLFSNRPRGAPIRIQADFPRESIRIKIPSGYTLDELPGAAKIESPYGALEAAWALHDGEITMEETLEIRETVAPASEYKQVRAFFEQVSGVRSAAVVLVKTPGQR
jgi:hypothetical protein